MKRGADGALLFSPSDLVIFLKSPFATWMDRRFVDEKDGVAPDEKDAQAALFSRKGDEHEAKVLARLKADGRRVVAIRKDDPDSVGATRRAIASGAQVIYQATLSHGDFTGFADFLVANEAGAFEVWDAKLSRSVKPEHLLQLCCYADLLSGGRGNGGVMLQVALGDGEHAAYRAADFHWYFGVTRSAFRDLIATFQSAAGGPDPEANADHGRWASHAEKWFEERDHLIRVANIRKSQIKRLREAGITTMHALAESQLGRVPGIGPDVVTRLVAQAQLQVRSVGRDVPEHQVLQGAAGAPPCGLSLLPPASENDIYFDLEGFPLGDEQLEYLFGVVTKEGAAVAYEDWWAHDTAAERIAFEAFIDFVMERWRRDRSLHVHHYGAYEITALKRLMGQHGTREDEVDALLRGGVFVDLLTVVRGGLLVGEPAYSLKNVEKLYRDERKGGVRDAGGSLVQYDEWLSSGGSSDWRKSPTLRDIRDYNRDDCESTAQLADWLRARQAEAGIPYDPARAPDPHPETPLKPDAQARRDLSIAMRSEAASMPAGTEDERERRRIHELLGLLVEFHRLEDKPKWWWLYEKCEQTHEDLVEDPECLGNLVLVQTSGPDDRGTHRVTYRFDPEQDTSVAVGSDVRVAHDVDVELVVDAFDAERGVAILKFTKGAATKLGGRFPERLSIVPYSYVSAKVIASSIAESAETLRAGGAMPRALEDFLRRRPPRVRGHDGGPLLRPGEDVLTGTHRVVANLDHSCLVIQGPPGSGKTYTAAQVIAKLLKAGKNVGVTSNGHKAIDNLLAACDAAHGGGLSFLKIGGSESNLATGEGGKRPRRLENKDGRTAYESGLVGGTSYLFARDEWRDTLDYLFVDEAGQVSVANLVGIARCTKNLVLIGDQMQLAQPTQGAHPGESGKSLLAYYMGTRQTISADQGVFLERTWRLHPALCGFISEAVYEGRLKHEAVTERHVVRVPGRGADLVRKEAGIIFVPVIHDGNVQASDEEVDTVRRVVRELLGRSFTDGRGEHELTLADILFVAPYNKQVRSLRAALGEQARVASVDKFQGQEAPVVILSMCASPGEFGPRGSAFLLDLNRLNVAVSRAKALAVIVGDPRLARSRPTSIAEMRRLNLLCRLIAEGS